MARTRNLGRWIAAGLTTLVIGCSSPTSAPTGRADGTVTLDGKPVAGGKLDLVSETGSASTPIGKDGTFVVPSLPAGKYKVAVGPVPGRSTTNPAAGVFHQDESAAKGEKSGAGTAVPKKYTDPATSGIEVEIGPTTGPLQIKLNRN